jgi:hypothetical protein
MVVLDKNNDFESFPTIIENHANELIRIYKDFNKNIDALFEAMEDNVFCEWFVKDEIKNNMMSELSQSEKRIKPDLKRISDLLFEYSCEFKYVTDTLNKFDIEE